MATFEKAFEDLVKDMYNAEKQVLKALPKAAKGAFAPELKAAFEEHATQTEEQAKRLEQVAEIMGFKPTGKVCAAAKGIIEEMSEALEEHDKGPVLDAVLICGGQKFEHYEIANYGTACEWAKLIGNEEVLNLLKETLDEEEQTDEKLSQLAENGLNEAAFNAEEEEGAGAKKMKKSVSVK